MYKDQPLVSICIAAYNHEGFILETINSVIDQTYQNIELFIINDGSKDNTDDVITSLIEKCNARFMSFKYLSRENKGFLATLKELEGYASGDYIAFLDSDDYYHKTKIEKQVKVLENDKESALCYSKMLGVNKDSKVIKHFKTKKNKSGFIFDALLKHNFISAPTVLIRHSVFKEFGGFDTKYNIQDFPMWLKIASKYKISYLEEELVFYRLHEENMSKRLSFIINEVHTILDDWSHTSSYKKNMKHYYFRWFCDLSKSEDKELCKKYMKLSLSSYFWHPKFLKSIIRYLKN